MNEARPTLTAEDVQWVTNDLAELGVKIGNQFFFLYKGDSLVYESVKHDDGSPMHWRPVRKREFGECAHPINYDNPELIGTVSLNDSDKWRELPAAQPKSPADDARPTRADEPSIAVDDIVAWMNLPETQARFAEGQRATAQAIADLNRARTVTRQQLHEPMTDFSDVPRPESPVARSVAGEAVPPCAFCKSTHTEWQANPKGRSWACNDCCSLGPIEAAPQPSSQAVDARRDALEEAARMLRREAQTWQSVQQVEEIWLEAAARVQALTPQPTERAISTASYFAEDWADRNDRDAHAAPEPATAQHTAIAPALTGKPASVVTTTWRPASIVVTTTHKPGDPYVIAQAVDHGEPRAAWSPQHTEAAVDGVERERFEAWLVNERPARTVGEAADMAKRAWRAALATPRAEADRLDAERYRALRDQMTFVESANVTGIALASASKRLWFHATDCEDWPLDAVADAARSTAPKGGA